MNKKLTNIFLSLAALLFLVGCGPRGNSFRLIGNIQGMQSGEIYIYNSSIDGARLDTLRVEDGQFHYGGNVEETTPYTIVFPNALEQVVFFGPGEEIEYEVVSSNLNNYVVSGSEANKLMNSLRSSIQNNKYSDRQMKIRKFIADNPKSPVSLYLFDRYFVQNAQASYKELLEVQKLIAPHHKDNTYFMQLSGIVKRMKELAVGDNFPDLTLTDRNLKSVKLWKSTSTYTAFVCWASWINSSYDLLYKMRDKSTLFSKDKMRVVAFSIDNEFERWTNMIRYDSISPVEQYCDTRAFDSPVLRKIGVNDIPTYFIIDKNHKVVAKGTDYNKFEDDIDKFGK